MVSTPPHELEFEVPGTDINRANDFLRLLLMADIELDSLRIQMASESPIVTNDILSAIAGLQGDDTDDPAELDREDIADVATTTDQESSTSEADDDVETDDEADHVTSALVDDETASNGSSGVEFDPQDAIDLTDRDVNDPPSLDELPDISVNLDPDRIGFHIMGLLYCVKDRLKLGEIHDSLEDTPWEEEYKSISAQLSVMKEEGLIDKDAKHAGAYQLTERGQHYVEAIVHDAESYPLNIGYKIAGLHPNSNGLKAT